MSRSRATVSLAVQLQNIGLQCFDDVGERRVVGINRERDFRRAALGQFAEIARGLEAEMAR